MAEREGVSPDGETPDRLPGARGTEPNAAPESAPSPPAPLHRAPADDERTAPLEPLAPFQPAEPTFRADPAVREYEVPFDTGQLRSISTGQLLIVHRPGADIAQAVEEQTQRRAYSWVAAVIGTIGAISSLFVGWMLPLSIAAIVFGVLGLRREERGRTLAFVGIGTGLAGLVFSAVWIGYYAIVFGALPN